MTWAAEHVVGVAQGVSEDIIKDLKMCIRDSLSTMYYKSKRNKGTNYI